MPDAKTVGNGCRCRLIAPLLADAFGALDDPGLSDVAVDMLAAFIMFPGHVHFSEVAALLVGPMAALYPQYQAAAQGPPQRPPRNAAHYGALTSGVSAEVTGDTTTAGDEDRARDIVRLTAALVEAHTPWLLEHWDAPGVQQIWMLLLESVGFPGACPAEQTVPPRPFRRVPTVRLTTMASASSSAGVQDSAGLPQRTRDATFEHWTGTESVAHTQPGHQPGHLSPRTGRGRQPGPRHLSPRTGRGRKRQPGYIHVRVCTPALTSCFLRFRLFRYVRSVKQYTPRQLAAMHAALDAVYRAAIPILCRALRLPAEDTWRRWSAGMLLRAPDMGGPANL